MQNMVYIATSLDGYIADRNGRVDWLQLIPNPDHLDFGFIEFLERIDAVVMGRNTFETVHGFEGDWPYTKYVFVLSNSLTALPDKYAGKAELVHGPLSKVLNTIHQRGYTNLYVDGGKTVQSFLKEDLIHEMIITIIPILLGGGIPLFGELSEPLPFDHVKTEVLLDAMVQIHYHRKPSRD
jgi:dihydrofolate reductase